MAVPEQCQRRWLNTRQVAVRLRLRQVRKASVMQIRIFIWINLDKAVAHDHISLKMVLDYLFQLNVCAVCMLNQ